MIKSQKRIGGKTKMKGMDRKIFFFSIVIILILSTCGKSEENKQNTAQQKYSPELQQAIDILNKIDPENDTLEEIIESYKNARKALSKKVSQQETTPEEKYVYFLSDSFLLFHQLIKFLNELAGIIISGNLDPQGISKLIEALPQSPQINQTKISSSQEEDLKIPYGCGGISGLAQTLCNVMDGIMLSRLEKGIKLLREIQTEVESSQKDFRVNMKSLPIKIQLLVLRYTLDFGGEHDLGTTYFFESGLDLIDAVFRLMFSVNIDLIGGITSIPNYVEKVSVTEDLLLHGGRIITFLLKNNLPTFGVSSILEVKRTRAQILSSIEKSQKFLEYVKQKNVDSKNSIIYYDSEKGEYYLRYKFNGETKEPSILKEKDAQNFINAVKKVKSNIENSQQYISTQDLVIISVTTLVAAIKSGLLDPVLDVAINLLSQDQANLIKNLLDSQLFTPGTVAGIISGVLGDIFYFDLGTMFKNLSDETPKTKYREWFPAWTTNRAEFEDNFIIEWDCGAKLYDESITQYKEGRTEFFGLSCTKPEQDIKHFENTITLSSIKYEKIQGWGNLNWFLTEDGTQSVFPYILFQDPSFGGLILIKGSSLKDKIDFLQNCGADTSPNPKSYFDLREAGNCALNTAIQSVIGNLIKSLSSSPRLANSNYY